MKSRTEKTKILKWSDKTRFDTWHLLQGKHISINGNLFCQIIKLVGEYKAMVYKINTNGITTDFETSKTYPTLSGAKRFIRAVLNENKLILN